MRIAVTGFIVPFPSAGLFWHYVNYLWGFEELGHDVWYFEDSGDSPWGWDHDLDEADPENTYGVRWLAGEMDRAGMSGRWAFVHSATGRIDGMAPAEFRDALASTDVLVNVSCSIPRRAEYAAVPHRLAVDTDPVFTQVKVAGGHPYWRAVPEWHTRLFTFGRPPLPAQQHEWYPTRQPVSERTPAAPAVSPNTPFTTIGNWKSYEPVRWGGNEYAMKDATLREFCGLPGLTSVPLAIALGPGSGREVGAAALEREGWTVVDGRGASKDMAAYRSFVERSSGEIGLAKHGYVAARSGWFSERTCFYLSLGRPAAVQDTGWSEWVDHGCGLVPFSSLIEAATALGEMSSDLDRHAAAARRLVLDQFNARDVCAELLEAAL